MESYLFIYVFHMIFRIKSIISLTDMCNVNDMLYAFFWVIPQRLKFICRRFGTLCLFHLHRHVGACRMN